MPEHEEEHRKHVALWIAVGGTAAAVVALWVMILPTQLRRIRLEAQEERSRWGVVEQGAEAPAKPLDQILDEQRATLDEIERRVQGDRQEVGAAARIRELKAKIEEASQRHSLEGGEEGTEGPEEIPAN